MNLPTPHPPLAGHSSRILTSTGIWFDVLEPDPAAIRIEDIANALSHLCRFGGHCRRFYCVTEHSMLVTRAVRQRHGRDRVLSRWALLHDASEAYVVDIPRPVKRQLPQYLALEEGIQKAIAKRFRLPWPMPEEVHRADGDLLAMELRAYMPTNDHGASLPPLPADLSMDDMPEEPLPPEDARKTFLRVAHLLGLQ